MHNMLLFLQSQNDVRDFAILLLLLLFRCSFQTSPTRSPLLHSLTALASSLVKTVADLEGTIDGAGVSLTNDTLMGYSVTPLPLVSISRWLFKMSDLI